MKLFAETVFRHIEGEIAEHVHGGDGGKKLLFMLPSVPATVVAEVGDRLEAYCTGIPTLHPPVIKTSKSLSEKWGASDDPNVTTVLNKGWCDDSGNLTTYRNTAAPSTGFLPVLLIGVDSVTDSSSLADFYHCDLDTIWQIELKGSFEPWIESTLTNARVGFEPENLDHFNQVFKAIVERGLADILQISNLLDKLDLVSMGVQDGKDAEDVLLRSLGEFHLPVFTGHAFGSRPSFAVSLDSAVSFFGYDAFLEERRRANAAKTIDAFKANKDLDAEFDVQGQLQGFSDGNDFLSSLRQYILTADRTSRARLLQCEFSAIEKVLDYRAPKTSTRRQRPEPVRKIRGCPIDAVLSAVWYTMAEFKKESVRQGVFAHQALSKVSIESILFRHDCEGESKDAQSEKAISYLSRLLGGVDFLIEKYFDFERLCGDSGQRQIASNLVRADLPCQASKSAEPFLQFCVQISGEGWKTPVQKQFAWRLPEIDSTRVAQELVEWVGQRIKAAQGFCLPVFNLSYYDELMLAKDDEETRRVLRQCIQDEGGKAFNLLAVPDIEQSDPLLPGLNKMAFAYDQLFQHASQHGLYSALTTKWDSFRKTYVDVFEDCFQQPACARKGSLSSFLYRAFLVIAERPPEQGTRWVWDLFEPSAVVTVMHPALLEMLWARVHYLFTCFMSAAGSELRQSGARAFQDSRWRNYVDLAAIQWPLTGLLTNSDPRLDTNIRGQFLIHRIGEPSESEATLTTRLLLRYDSTEDDDVSDAELFCKTRESALLFRILRDYLELHPHANDGLSIAVYQNTDIQPVISAVDQLLRHICSDSSAPKERYSMTVTVFTESSDDTSVSRWINQWKERWEASETEGTLSHYRRVTLSVAHRIVSSEDSYRQFCQLIAAGLEVDIAVLNGFITAGSEGSDFEEVGDYDITARTLKFPILEKSFCAQADPGQQLRRARVLSNRQFRACTLHSELMARIKRRGRIDSQHVVLGFGDFAPWQNVIDELHARAEWVVCIDPNIDERLISQKSQSTPEQREIIGFGSGVGSHGEANYTVSTEQFKLSDVSHRLQASIANIYHGWTSQDFENASQRVLAESRNLSGLSLVRATGLGEYVRDFMAYALTRRILVSKAPSLCDQLVSLDAYRHWFDTADSDTRPDLLWLKANLTDEGRLHIDMRMIECKLAKTSDAHLDKARQQLQNGLRHLITMFRPRHDQTHTEDDRPDQRYWWLQIHRLIASKAEIKNPQQTKVLTALERLSEGDFSIEWHASALTFWTDQECNQLTPTETWPFSVEGKDIEIGAVAAGKEYVRTICATEPTDDFHWPQASIRFDPQIRGQQSAESSPGAEENDDEDDGGIPSLTPSPTPPASPPTAQPSVEPPSPPATTQEGKATSKGGDTLSFITQKEATIPDRILLGKTTNGSRPVYWEFGHKRLNNRHLLIFGQSGMGKTYTIQCLLAELAARAQNSLVVDYTEGFKEEQLEAEFIDRVNPLQHFVRRHPLAINPFRQQVEIVGGERFLQRASQAAERVAGVFREVYRYGDQQYSALYQAIKNGIERSGEKGMVLSDLLAMLEEISETKGTVAQSSRSVISKIRPFLDQQPFGNEDSKSWERFYSDREHRCHVLQLMGFSRDSARLITEFSLIDLYWFYRSTGSKAQPRIVVLDEVQNLDQREESPLAQLLREGRKFGFSLVLATQIMSNLSKDAKDRLFNAAHKLFFRPSDTEIRTYADIAALFTNEKAEEWMKRLASLKLGECYSLGPSLNTTTENLELKSFRINVSSFAERNGNGKDS